MTADEGVELPTSRADAITVAEVIKLIDGAQVELSTSGPLPFPTVMVAPPPTVKAVEGQDPVPSNVNGAIGNGSSEIPALALFHARGTALNVYDAPVAVSETDTLTFDIPAAVTQDDDTSHVIVEAQVTVAAWVLGTLFERIVLTTGVVVTPPVHSCRNSDVMVPFAILT